MRTGCGWRRWVVATQTTDPLALLDALNAAGVEYLVVGGAAAVLHGAPVTTQDLDIVHRSLRKTWAVSCGACHACMPLSASLDGEEVFHAAPS